MVRYRSKRETERTRTLMYEGLRARLLTESVQGATLEELLETVAAYSTGDMPYQQQHDRMVVGQRMRIWLEQTARSSRRENPADTKH